MREVIPQPGYTVEQIEAVIASGQFAYAECYTITPLVGDALRYTRYQQDVALVPIGEVVRQIYRARQVQIRGLLMKSSIGVSVDEQNLQLDYVNQQIFQAALTWPQALLQGRLDGASVRRDRYVAEYPGAPWMGGARMFSGLVGELSMVGRQSATMNVSSDLVLLDTKMPRDLWKPNCKNKWGDVHCGVVQADWAVEGEIGANPTRSTIPWADASSEYALGKIHISNGDDVTRVRTVSRADSTNLYLSYPLDFDPLETMHFTAYPGDSRTMERCEHFHGADWRKRFKGFPFTPVPETAL